MLASIPRAIVSPAIKASGVAQPVLSRLISDATLPVSTPNSTPIAPPSAPRLQSTEQIPSTTPTSERKVGITPLNSVSSARRLRDYQQNDGRLTIQERRRLASLLAGGAPFNGTGMTSIYGPEGELLDNASEKPAFYHDDETKSLMLRILHINIEDRSAKKTKPDVGVNNAGTSHPRRLPRSSRPRTTFKVDAEESGEQGKPEAGADISGDDDSQQKSGDDIRVPQA